MGRHAARWGRLLVAASLVFGGARTQGGVDPDPAGDALVADLQGLPDVRSDSGAFLAQVATGNHSITAPSHFRIRLPAAAATLRLAVFDGNNAGLWDQNLVDGPAVDAVVRYELRAEPAPGSPPPADPIALAESETLSSAQTPGVLVFRNAVDSRWELLVLDRAVGGDPVQPDGTRHYVLTVGFRDEGVGSFPAIDGFKIAANGDVFLAPPADGTAVFGGFIGGLVDSTDHATFADPATSRDPYPDALKAFEPPRPPGDVPRANRYAGVLEVPVLLEPAPGQTWAEFVAGLRLSDGDVDDATDEGGVSEDGTPQLSPRPGLPPDDPLPPGLENEGNAGGYRMPRIVGTERRNNLHFGLPGRPRLEILAPDGTVVAAQTDLSGNVGRDPGDDAAGFEKVLIPADVAQPGVWRLRFTGIDARNTIFVRASVPVPEPLPPVDLAGLVTCDHGCDGALEAGEEPLPGVTVRIRRPADGFEETVETGPDGTWSRRYGRAGTYEVRVDPTQPALAGRSRTVPDDDAQTFSLAPGDSASARFAYCCCAPSCAPCACGPDGKVHRIALVTRFWVGARRDFRVRIAQRKGCGPRGPLVDRLDVAWTGDALPGGVRGRSGILELVAAGVQDGELVLYFVSTAQAPVWLDGAFRGSQRFEVVVDGFGTTAACGEVACDCLRVNEAWPCGSCPPTPCGCRAKFLVADFVPWKCGETPCEFGCVRPPSHWRNWNRQAKKACRRIPWPAPGDEDDRIGNETWLQVLKSGHADAWHVLAREYVATTLNAYAGACLPDAVREALDRARALLDRTAPPLSPEDRESALWTALVLQQYDAGSLGPKRCPPAPPCADPKALRAGR